jgi:hypothetical protein
MPVRPPKRPACRISSFPTQGGSPARSSAFEARVLREPTKRLLRRPRRDPRTVRSSLEPSPEAPFSLCVPAGATCSSATPPPGTMLSSSAARVACRASSTRCCLLHLPSRSQHQPSRPPHHRKAYMGAMRLPTRSLPTHAALQRARAQRLLECRPTGQSPPRPGRGE